MTPPAFACFTERWFPSAAVPQEHSTLLGHSIWHFELSWRSLHVQTTLWFFRVHDVHLCDQLFVSALWTILRYYLAPSWLVERSLRVNRDFCCWSVLILRTRVPHAVLEDRSQAVEEQRGIARSRGVAMSRLPRPSVRHPGREAGQAGVGEEGSRHSWHS